MFDFIFFRLEYIITEKHVCSVNQVSVKYVFRIDNHGSL
jgi:hypothetical protein